MFFFIEVYVIIGTYVTEYVCQIGVTLSLSLSLRIRPRPRVGFPSSKPLVWRKATRWTHQK
jgi:hypothetical protein